MRTPEAGGRARGFDRPAPAEVAAWGGARDKLALEAQVGTLIDLRQLKSLLEAFAVEQLKLNAQVEDLIDLQN